MIIWLIFFLFLQTKSSFPLSLPGPSWTFLLLRIQSLQCLKVINLTKLLSGPRIFKLLNLCGNQLISIPRCLCLCSLCFWGKYSNSRIFNDIGRNCFQGHIKKIAKFLMRTFACRSTLIYGLHSFS